MEESIAFEGKNYTGVKFNLGNVPLLIIKARKGYVACSYIDRDAAEKFGDIACFVSDVKTFDDVLRAKVKSMTTWADEFGIRKGMSVKKALEILDSDQQ